MWKLLLDLFLLCIGFHVNIFYNKTLQRHSFIKQKSASDVLAAVLQLLKPIGHVMKKEQKPNKSHNYFENFSCAITKATGTPTAFLIAFLVVVTWAVTGPIFHYSDTWQLVINTGTTIITFLMVFLIQQSQNKDTVAVHLKLDELLASSEQADNKLVNAEELTGDELKLLKKLYARMNANDGVEPLSDTPSKIATLLKEEESKSLENTR